MKTKTAPRSYLLISSFLCSPYKWVPPRGRNFALPWCGECRGLGAGKRVRSSLLCTHLFFLSKVLPFSVVILLLLSYWVGVCSPLPKAVNLHMAKISNLSGDDKVAFLKIILNSRLECKSHTQFLIRIAKKPVPFGATHTYIAHIREYSSPGNNYNNQPWNSFLYWIKLKN